MITRTGDYEPHPVCRNCLWHGESMSHEDLPEQCPHCGCPTASEYGLKTIIMRPRQQRNMLLGFIPFGWNTLWWELKPYDSAELDLSTIPNEPLHVNQHLLTDNSN